MSIQKQLAHQMHMSLKKVSVWFKVMLALLILLWAAPASAKVIDADLNKGDPQLLTLLTDAPRISALTLSSDGHYLSALLRQDDGDSRVAVWRSSGSIVAAEELPYRRPDINWLSWVGGGRLLISLKENGLVIYDAHTARLRPLIDPLADLEGGTAGPRPNDLPPVLLSTLPDDDASILLQWEDPAVPGYPAVYKVDAVKGTSEKVMGAWRPIIRWWASPNGNIELGEGYRARRQLFFGRRAGGEWAKISDRDFFRGPAHTLLSVDAGGATAAVIAAIDSNTRDLWRMDTRTGQFIAKLASHPKFDISSAFYDPVSSNLTGASYWEGGAQRLYFREGDEGRLKGLATQIGVKHLSLTAASRNGSVRLYRSRANWRPFRYFVVGARSHDGQTADASDDVRVESHATDIYEVTYPDPAQKHSAPTYPEITNKSVWIPLKGRSKRGLGPMHALLSQPKESANGKAIVMVHGGPVRRVNDTYSPLVSWLVANGYTILRPNFRGSSGFGEKWRRAGYAQWGEDMQDDVRTAAEWLVNAGFADKKDMCVMGGSYGGYAALLSSIKDDDLFSCAISLNGVTSVSGLVEYLKANRFNLLTIPRIQGKLSRRSLIKRSPLYRADLVRLPVLMLHATEDLNVPFRQGKNMAAALAKYEKEFDFIVLEGAEHQLKRARDRRTYFQSALNFLDRYLDSESANRP